MKSVHNGVEGRTAPTKCVLLVPDGVGVRNFVLGNFLHRFKDRGGNVHALHVIPDPLIETMNPGLNGNVAWKPLLPYKQPPLALALEYSLLYAQMYWADTQAMRYLRDWPILGSARHRAVVRTAKAVGRIAASPSGIRKLDQWHCSTVGRLPLVQRYRDAFRELRPSVVFCTHQRPPDILPPILAAKEMGIPTATFIFSWDNLSSKGRIAAPFDHYLVWSELMRSEMIKYYPEVDPSRIHIVGTPQFDPYANKSLLWSKEEFLRRVGADAGRPLICYSGGDTRTCPDDPAHVSILLKLIRTGQIRGNPQVLVRPAPVDNGKRYEKVREQFPEVLISQPAWVHTTPGDWFRVMPTQADIQMLANITHHADLNVNLGSTMTLDFAIHDKPVVNVAFDVSDPPVFGHPVWEFFYRFEHYVPVVKLQAARFARTEQEMADHVNSYLDDPTLDRIGRQRLVDLQVGAPIGTSSDLVIDALQRISRDS